MGFASETLAELSSRREALRDFWPILFVNCLLCPRRIQVVHRWAVWSSGALKCVWDISRPAPTSIVAAAMEPLEVDW